MLQMHCHQMSARSRLSSLPRAPRAARISRSLARAQPRAAASGAVPPARKTVPRRKKELQEELAGAGLDSEGTVEVLTARLRQHWALDEAVVAPQLSSKMTEDDLEKLKKADLIKELAARDLSTDGLKRDLVGRLLTSFRKEYAAPWVEGGKTERKAAQAREAKLLADLQKLTAANAGLQADREALTAQAREWAARLELVQVAGVERDELAAQLEAKTAELGSFSDRLSALEQELGRTLDSLSQLEYLNKEKDDVIGKLRQQLEEYRNVPPAPPPAAPVPTPSGGGVATLEEEGPTEGDRQRLERSIRGSCLEVGRDQEALHLSRPLVLVPAFEVDTPPLPAHVPAPVGSPLRAHRKHSAPGAVVVAAVTAAGRLYRALRSVIPGNYKLILDLVSVGSLLKAFLTFGV